MPFVHNRGDVQLQQSFTALDPNSVRAKSHSRQQVQVAGFSAFQRKDVALVQKVCFNPGNSFIQLAGKRILRVADGYVSPAGQY